MRIAVTGGTGFVGAYSVRALLEHGHDVRLLVERGSDPSRTLGPVGVPVARLDVVVGDIRDAAARRSLLEGADALLHMAGVVGVDDRRSELMWQVNVDATSELLASAARQGLDPVVHVASYSALFPSPDPAIGPDSPTAVGRSAYGRTKATADRIARTLQAAGAPVVITYPSSVIGPPAGPVRGITADGWAPLLRTGWGISVEGGMAMIDVRDLAEVHAAVMEPGRGPRRYVCGGTMVRFDELIDALAEAAGRPMRRIRLSPRAFMLAGRVADLAARWLPVAPGFSYEAAWLLTSATPTDDSATLRDLGVTWRPIRETLLASLEDATQRDPVRDDLSHHQGAP